MAKASKEEQRKAPILRFKGFTDDWEQRKLGKVATFINGRAYKQNELLDSGKYKVLRVGNFYTNDSWYYSNLELADKYYIDKGDLVYTWSATFGPHIWDGEKVIYHYHIWKIELSKFLDRDFTLQILEADKAKLLANTNGSTMIHVTKKDMESKVISLPIIEEQKQIGLYLTKFDTLIALYERKVKLLTQIKKYLLDNLFAEKDYPNLRFKGFTDAWEQRKLGEIVNYKNGRAHEKQQLDNGRYELINLNSISIDGGLKHSGKYVNNSSSTLKKDDLVMILSDVAHGDLLGRVAIIPEQDKFVLNQRVALLRKKSNVNIRFLFSYINAHQKYFRKQGSGSSQLNISKNSVENFTIMVPVLSEQSKVGKLFEILDNLIALYEDKQQHLTEIKKTLLNIMFI